LLEHLLAPTGVGPQIDADLEVILLHGQDAGAGVVQLVDGSFAIDIDALDRRDNLGYQIETVGIAFVVRLSGAAVGHNDVWLWIIVLYCGTDVHANSSKGRQCRCVSFKGVKQQSFEVAGNALMRKCRRRHHHGDTVDKLPALLVRPAFNEFAKLPNRQALR
jgi:hypothetical protein